MNTCLPVKHVFMNKSQASKGLKHYGPVSWSQIIIHTTHYTNRQTLHILKIYREISFSYHP